MVTGRRASRSKRVTERPRRRGGREPHGHDLSLRASRPATASPRGRRRWSARRSRSTRRSPTPTAPAHAGTPTAPTRAAGHGTSRAAPPGWTASRPPGATSRDASTGRSTTAACSTASRCAAMTGPPRMRGGSPGHRRASATRTRLTVQAAGLMGNAKDRRFWQVFVDRAFDQWQTPSLARRVVLATARSRPARSPRPRAGDGLVWDIPNESLPEPGDRRTVLRRARGLTSQRRSYQGARTGAFTGFEAPTLLTSTTTGASRRGEHDRADARRHATHRDTHDRGRYLLLRAFVTAGPVTPPPGICSGTRSSRSTATTASRPTRSRTRTAPPNRTASTPPTSSATSSRTTARS
jgi:hypothetical protein